MGCSIQVRPVDSQREHERKSSGVTVHAIATLNLVNHYRERKNRADAMPSLFRNTAGSLADDD